MRRTMRLRAHARSARGASGPRRRGPPSPPRRGNWPPPRRPRRALGIGPQMDDEMLRRAYADRVREADQRVARAQGAVATAKTNQANLEEEARRSGALPGWLR